MPPQSCGGGRPAPAEKRASKKTPKVSEMHRKRPRAGLLSPHPLCRQKVLSSASSSAGKGEVGGKKKGGDSSGTPTRLCPRGGSVRWLPVHAEAVDAGVLGVAPVAQHPQLHQLEGAHGVTLGDRGDGSQRRCGRGGGHGGHPGGFWRFPQAGRGPSVPLSLLSSRLPVKERLKVATPKCPTPQSEGSEDHTTPPRPHHHPPGSLLRFGARTAAPRLTSRRNVWMGLPSWS